MAARTNFVANEGLNAWVATAAPTAAPTPRPTAVPGSSGSSKSVLFGRLVVAVVVAVVAVAACAAVALVVRARSRKTAGYALSSPTVPMEAAYPKKDSSAISLHDDEVLLGKTGKI